MPDINVARFMIEAAQIALTCEKYSYMDKDYCSDEHGHNCPFSAKGGCVFIRNWAVIPCELLKRGEEE